MKSVIPLVFAALFASETAAQTTSEEVVEAVQEETSEMGPTDIVEINLNDFVWRKRPIVVFADSDQDPRFIEQIELLTSRIEALEARDVVILTDTNPDELSDLRRKLRPRGFMLVLIGKDGGVKLRKPFPWSVRELNRSIDKMPLRREEIRLGQQNGG